jgi:undecaprenyl-diphosphatase
MKDSMETFNEQLFLALNAGPETSHVVLLAAKFIASGLILFIPLLLAGMWLWGSEARRNLVLKALFFTIVNLAVNFVIGLIWYHPRPLAIELGHTYFNHALDASFPSDHATIFFIIGFALLKNETRLGWGLLLAGAVVGWARVFLGVHFPLDILGALVAAFVVCTALSPLWDKFGKSVTGYGVRLYRTIFAPLISRGWIKS